MRRDLKRSQTSKKSVPEKKVRIRLRDFQVPEKMAIRAIGTLFYHVHASRSDASLRLYSKVLANVVRSLTQSESGKIVLSTVSLDFEEFSRSLYLTKIKSDTPKSLVKTVAAAGKRCIVIAEQIKDAKRFAKYVCEFEKHLADPEIQALEKEAQMALDSFVKKLPRRWVDLIARLDLQDLLPITEELYRFNSYGSKSILRTRVATENFEAWQSSRAEIRAAEGQDWIVLHKFASRIPSQSVGAFDWDTSIEIAGILKRRGEHKNLPVRDFIEMVQNHSWQGAKINIVRHQRKQFCRSLHQWEAFVKSVRDRRSAKSV